jgi:hypothetical protein
VLVVSMAGDDGGDGNTWLPFIGADGRWGVDEVGVGNDAVDTVCLLRRGVPLGLAPSGRADLREERSGDAEVSSFFSIMLPYPICWHSRRFEVSWQTHERWV